MSETPERLSKLVLMLSSEYDGEVLASVRKIGDLLKQEGLDWHCFSETMLVLFAERRSSREIRICAWLKLRSKDLNGWEQEFVESIHSKLSRGRTLTDKQKACLEKTYAAYGGQ